MTNQEFIDKALKNLSFFSSEWITLSPVLIRNYLMDTCGPEWPEITRNLGWILSQTHFLQRLSDALQVARPLQSVNFLQDEKEKLTIHLSEQKITETKEIFVLLVQRYSEMPMNQAEQDLVDMVIRPKLKTGPLSLSSEQEISEAAEVKNISRSRVKQLIEIYQHQYNFSRESEHNGNDFKSANASQSDQRSLASKDHYGAITKPKNIIIGVGVTFALVVGLLLITSNQGNSSSQNNSSVADSANTPVEPTTPEPTPIPTPNRDQVAHVIEEWQRVKKYSFINYDTSKLDTVLTGKALEETVGGVNWWKNTPGAEYYEIELIDMTVDSVTFPDTTTAHVTAHVTERKSDNQSGNRTSTYKVIYYLVYQGGQWYIRDWVV